MITNTAATTPAQKIGRWYAGRCPSLGISVQPYTSPASSLSGLGLVIRLTTTVTPPQASPLHRARNMFSAIGFASGESAM